MMEKYVMKYDKQDNLYCYIERNKKGRILSYFNLTNNRLIRYDAQSKYKYLIDYNETCRLVQRFMESESWVTVLRNSSSLYNQKSLYVGMLPNKKQEICVKGKQIIAFTISKEFVDNFKYVSTATHKNISFTSPNEGNAIISPIY